MRVMVRIDSHSAGTAGDRPHRLAWWNGPSAAWAFRMRGAEPQRGPSGPHRLAWWNGPSAAWAFRMRGAEPQRGPSGLGLGLRPARSCVCPASLRRNAQVRLRLWPVSRAPRLWDPFDRHENTVFQQSVGNRPLERASNFKSILTASILLCPARSSLQWSVETRCGRATLNHRFHRCHPVSVSARLGRRRWDSHYPCRLMCRHLYDLGNYARQSIDSICHRWWAPLEQKP